MSDEDLPARLRQEAEILPHELYSWLNPVLGKAADEIEQLRKELGEWRMGYRRSGIHPVCPACSNLLPSASKP